MTEKIKKNDFIELEYTGKANDNIFDTTNPKEAEELGVQDPKNIKPQIISVGNKMVIKGLDDSLEGKELNKKYTINLQPGQAFGKRDPSLIRTYSSNHFKKQNLNPYPGMALQLDNTIAKVISVSGGRVTMDFNNPLAGKEIDYDFKIKKLITDDKEKINALQDFFFKRRFEFKIMQDEKTKTKKIIFKDSNIEPFLQMLGEKFKTMTGFEFEVEKKATENKEEKTSKPKQDKESNKEVSESSPKGLEDTKTNRKLNDTKQQ